MNFAPAPMLDAFIAARYKPGNTRDVMKSGLRRCILSLLAESGSLESDTPVPGAVVTDERIRAACEEAQPGKAYFVRLLREWCVEVARATKVTTISNEEYLEMVRNEDIVRQGYDYAGCPEPPPGYKWVVMDGLGGITPADAEKNDAQYPRLWHRDRGLTEPGWWTTQHITGGDAMRKMLPAWCGVDRDPAIARIKDAAEQGDPMVYKPLLDYDPGEE